MISPPRQKLDREIDCQEAMELGFQVIGAERPNDESALRFFDHDVPLAANFGD